VTFGLDWLANGITNSIIFDHPCAHRLPVKHAAIFCTVAEMNVQIKVNRMFVNAFYAHTNKKMFVDVIKRCYLKH